MKTVQSSGGQVHVVQRMELGGIQTLMLDVLQARRNPADRLYSLEGTQPELITAWPRLEAFADRLVAFDHQGGVRPSLTLRVARQLRRDRPRSVVLHHIGPLLYGASGARLAGIRRVLHVEHDVWHYADASHRRIAAFSSRLFRPRHVAVSEPHVGRMHEIMGDRPIAVIPPAIDTGRFNPGDRTTARRRLNLPVAARIVGSVGRLVAVKAYDLLIDAVAALPDDVHLVLVGDGPEQPLLVEHALRKQVSPRVHFLGLRSDLPEILPAFDLFCLSSHNEGLPRVVLEAQACDLPVVATDVGALRDGVCPATSRLVPAGDAGLLAEALRLHLAAVLPAGEARKFVIENYGFDTMLQAYDRVLEGAA